MNFKAWWTIGKGIWITLIAGYSWVLLSLIIGFEEPSSGAVLICAGIIAELVFERLPWRSYARHFGMGLIEKKPHEVRAEPYEEQDFYGRTDDSMMISGGVEILDNLRILAGKKDQSRDLRKWSISSTAARVEFVLILWIGITLILGTVLWEYGDLIFQV